MDLFGFYCAYGNPDSGGSGKKPEVVSDAEHDEAKDEDSHCAAIYPAGLHIGTGGSNEKNAFLHERR